MTKKEFAFVMSLIVVALATLPLGLWSIPIVALYGFGVGTKIGFLNWKEFRESLDVFG